VREDRARGGTIKLLCISDEAAEAPNTWRCYYICTGDTLREKNANVFENKDISYKYGRIFVKEFARQKIISLSDIRKNTVYSLKLEGE